MTLAYTQTELLQKNVYLFERLENIETVNIEESAKFMKAIIFIRPIDVRRN